jgi:hypothetical protein
MKLATCCALAAAALSLSACAAPPSTSFRQDAFHHPVHTYRVLHAEGGQLAPSVDWSLDNYQLDDAGQPVKPKSGPDYEHTLELDSDDDGTTDVSKTVASYDLLFRNRKTDGRIWVRSPPIGLELRNTELRLLARKYVESIAGGGAVSVDLRAGKVTIEPRYAIKYVSVAEATLDDHPAIEATFDMATLEQATVDPNVASERVRVVVVRPSFHFRASDVDFPVLFLAGYSNRPEDFERELPAFDQLLDRIQLMTEAEMVASVGADVFACKPDASKLSVVVKLDVAGEIGWAYAQAPGESPPEPPLSPSPLNDAANFPTCIGKALAPVPFEATGAARSLTIPLEKGATVRAPRGYKRGPAIGPREAPEGAGGPVEL